MPAAPAPAPATAPTPVAQPVPLEEESVGAYPVRSCSLLRPRRQGDHISEHNQRRRHLADACLPLRGRNPARLTAVLISLINTCARQRGMTLGGDDHGACEGRRARSTAIGLGNTHYIDAVHLLR